MDINGVKFHMLTSSQDWQAVFLKQSQSQQETNIWWDSERQSLSLSPRIPRFNTQQDQTLLATADRRGAASDLYGNIFWISDDNTSILFQPSGLNENAQYWSVNELQTACLDRENHGDFKTVASETGPTLPTLRGLAITQQQYLVVGAIAPAGLLVFDLYDGGAPLWLTWSLADFAPFDMASDEEGGVWILDINTDIKVWHLDRYFRVVLHNDQTTEHFSPSVTDPVEKEASCLSLQSIKEEHAITIDMSEAFSIESLPDGTVIVLGNINNLQGSVIHRYKNRHLVNEILLDNEKFNAVINSTTINAHDLLLVKHDKSEPGIISGDLIIVDEVGNQAYLFILYAEPVAADPFKIIDLKTPLPTKSEIAENNGITLRELERVNPGVDWNNLHEGQTIYIPYGLSLNIQPRYLPLRRYTGKGLVTINDKAYYDIDQQWFPITPQPRQRYEDEGKLSRIIFDGKELDCVWHRVLLDACIPQDASVLIESRTANEARFLESADWRIEPTPYLRANGSEITWHQPFSDKETVNERIGTWELLFQHARGRFIEIRLTLKGNGRVSPRIRAMRVYYPRFSYLERYLPSVYSDNPDSASFLDRFLANTEGFFSTLEDRIAKAQILFDVRATPHEFLEWLAAWVNIAFDPDWDEYRKRLFLANAILLYRWRGTQVGLRALIRLAIDPCPDENIFAELSGAKEYAFGGAVGQSVRIIEKFLSRGFPGVVLGDPRETQGPSLVRLDEQPTDTNLNNRYRDFLRRQYAEFNDSEADALAKVNASWERNFNSFDEITYRFEPPQQASELKDWRLFVKEEVALYNTWQPAYGGYALHVRYQHFLRQQYSALAESESPLDLLNSAWNSSFEAFEEIQFPPLKPDDQLIAQDWVDFIKTSIGFTYSEVTQADEQMYKEFIARRYRRIKEYNEYYQLSEILLNSFDEVKLPENTTLPKDGAPLEDWIAFVSTTVPIKRNAHQFTVLVPTAPGELPDQRRLKLSKVKAIVDREKPTHTNYDIKLYWALFQVGTARLGADTLLGESSRYVAMVLGVNYLGQGFVSESTPWNMENRSVIGRESLQQTAYGEHSNE